MKTFLIALGAIIFCRMASAQVAFDTVSSFAQAQQKAATEHKFVMVDVFTDWCYWCKVLDKNTYSTKSVGDYAANNFIALKTDAEKGDGIGFAKKYNVHGYPTILFFDEKGNEVDRVVGYQPEDKFLISMKTARAGGMQGLEEQRKLHPDDPHVLFTLAQKYAEKGDTTQALALSQQVVSLDYKDSLKLAENAAYYIAEEASHAADLQPLEQYIVIYPHAENVEQAHATLMHEYLRKHDGENAAKHFKAVDAIEPENPQLYNSYAWECAQAKVNLESAAGYADKAIGLAKDGTTKVVFMDTKAYTLYQQNKIQDAVTLEKQAITMLENNQTNARLRGELKKNLAMFEKELAQK